MSEKLRILFFPGEEPIVSVVDEEDVEDEVLVEEYDAS